jgi:hypothetical protein
MEVHREKEYSVDISEMIMFRNKYWGRGIKPD